MVLKTFPRVVVFLGSLPQKKIALLCFYSQKRAKTKSWYLPRGTSSVTRDASSLKILITTALMQGEDFYFYLKTRNQNIYLVLKRDFLWSYLVRPDPTPPNSGGSLLGCLGPYIIFLF